MTSQLVWPWEVGGAGIGEGGGVAGRADVGGAGVVG